MYLKSRVGENICSEEYFYIERESDGLAKNDSLLELRKEQLVWPKLPGKG